STRVPAASTLACSRSGWRAITSSAEAPIDPVAPSTATRRVAVSLMSPAAISEPEPGLGQGEHRQRRDDAVDAVEDAAVAGNEVAGVLGADMALEQALEQVAHHREQ